MSEMDEILHLIVPGSVWWYCAAVPSSPDFVMLHCKSKNYNNTSTNRLLPMTTWIHAFLAIALLVSIDHNFTDFLRIVRK